MLNNCSGFFFQWRAWEEQIRKRKQPFFIEVKHHAVLIFN